MNNELRIQEIIQKRGIIKLIHVTRKKNLKSIYEHGILPRKKLDEKKIEYVFNDNKRLDGWLNASSISVTKLNPFLIQSFNERHNLKRGDWFEIQIKPSILTVNECIFCDTNAASATFNPYRNNTENLKSLKLWMAFEGMFNNKIYQTQRSITRIGQKTSETTCNQAEICIVGKIPINFFINLNNLEKEING